MWNFLKKIDEKANSTIIELDKSVIFNSKSVYFHLQNILERMIKFYAYKLELNKSYIEPKVRETLRSLINKENVKRKLINDGFDVNKIEEIAIKANKLKHSNNSYTFDIEEIIIYIKVLHQSGLIIYKKLYNESGDIFNAEFYRILSFQKASKKKFNQFKRDSKSINDYKLSIINNSKEEIFLNLNQNNKQQIIKINSQVKKNLILSKYFKAIILVGFIVTLALISNLNILSNNPYNNIIEESPWDYCNIDTCFFNEIYKNPKGQTVISKEWQALVHTPIVYVKEMHFYNPGVTQDFIEIFIEFDLLSGITKIYAEKNDIEIIYYNDLLGVPNTGICFAYAQNGIEHLDILENDFEELNLCEIVQVAYNSLQGELVERFWLDDENSPSLYSVHRYYKKNKQIFKYIERYL